MLRGAPISIAVSIAALFVMSSDPAFSRNADYEYVKNFEGRRIGMVYEHRSEGLIGELAIHLETGYFLFVRCKTGEKRWGQQHMRRHDRNCEGHFAPWPANIMTHIAQVEHLRVGLDGPPETCGICIEHEFRMFELPDGVEVIPPGADSILGDRGPPIQLPMTDPPFDPPILPFDLAPGMPGPFDPPPRIPSPFDTTPGIPSPFDTTPGMPSPLDPTFGLPDMFDPAPGAPDVFVPAPGMPGPGGAPSGGGMPGGGPGP